MAKGIYIGFFWQNVISVNNWFLFIYLVVLFDSNKYRNKLLFLMAVYSAY